MRVFDRQMGPPSPTALFRRLTNPQDVTAATCLALVLLSGEALLSTLIIRRVAYTEIDWIAYVQQVEGFLQGERDYRALKGPTGPLVYPAGFLYFYTVLYWLSGGGNIPSAQAAFVVLYLLTQALVFWLYIRARAVPPLALALLCASKRLHSIFLLRLFNDGPAMLVAYAASALLVLRRWRAAIVCFSAAVSIKMNVLLMAPSVLVIVLKGATPEDVVKGTAAGALLQVVLGAPFLLQHPWAYISRAFELSRVFLHVWSVNLKFLPEPIFQARSLAVALMTAHLAVLWLFARYSWCKPEGGLSNVISAFMQRSEPRLSLRHSRNSNPGRSVRDGSFRPAAREPHMRLPSVLRAEHVLMILFSGNFIGIVFSRTLHYQFYAWYFHTLPFLLWQADMHWIVRCGLQLAIEMVWNIYPSTATSSVSLLACHFCVLIALWFGLKPVKPYEKLS